MEMRPDGPHVCGLDPFCTSSCPRTAGSALHGAEKPAQRSSDTSVLEGEMERSAAVIARAADVKATARGPTPPGTRRCRCQ